MMKRFLTTILALLFVFVNLVSCARDLSNDVYESDNTLGLTVEGTIVSTRPVTIKGSDKLENNTVGGLAGGVAGGALGSNIGGGSGQGLALVAGAIIGAVAGAAIQGELSKSPGFEYIVEVDVNKIKSFIDNNKTLSSLPNKETMSDNGLLTIIQGKDVVFNKGDKVYVIFSKDRARIIKR